VHVCCSYFARGLCARISAPNNNLLQAAAEEEVAARAEAEKQRRENEAQLAVKMLDPRLVEEQVSFEGVFFFDGERYIEASKESVIGLKDLT